jgi:hypothetical protein
MEKKYLIALGSVLVIAAGLFLFGCLGGHDTPVVQTGAQGSYESYQVFTGKVTLTNDSAYNNVTFPLVVGTPRQIFINATGTNVSTFLFTKKNNAVVYNQSGVTAALLVNGTYLNQTAVLPYYYGPLTFSFKNGTMAGNGSTLTVELTVALTT